MRAVSRIIPIIFLAFAYAGEPAPADNKPAFKAVGSENQDKDHFDFEQGNHRMRLENVNVHGDGKRAWGTFTLTNRRRIKPDVHLFCQIDVRNGAVHQSDGKTDGGGNWTDLMPILSRLTGSSANELQPLADAIAKVGTNGDAQVAFAHSLWQILEMYKHTTK